MLTPYFGALDCRNCLCLGMKTQSARMPLPSCVVITDNIGRDDARPATMQRD